jgi:LPS-assembly lipoprotein
MWWYSQHRTGRLAALRLAFAVGLMALGLTGCGFHPLYGKSAADPEVLQKLASVQVTPMQDRQGQLMRNALVTDLNPLGEPVHPRYRLVVTLTVTETQQALRTDDTATRDIVNYTIVYWLYDGETRIAAGSFTQMFSYDFLEEHYANISAADDIHHRAAQSIADEIRNRLAAYFDKAAEVKAQTASPAKP